MYECLRGIRCYREQEDPLSELSKTALGSFVQKVVHLYRLIVTPERFVEVVTDIIVAEDRVANPSVVAVSGEYPPERRASIRESVQKQARSIRRGFALGLTTTALTIAAGAATGVIFRMFFGAPVKVLVYFIQAVGAAVFLGATLAEVGGDIMTWDRVSIPEKLNKLIFHGLYVAGTYLFVLSVAWDAV